MRRPGGAASQFQRSGSNVDDPLAVVRIASLPRRVGKSKIARIDDFLSTNAKLLPKLIDPAMAMERRRS